MVNHAAEILGFERVLIVNLLGVPTVDIPAMSAAGREVDAWLQSRTALIAGLRQGSELLAAWGCRGLRALHVYTARPSWLGSEVLPRRRVTKQRGPSGRGVTPPAGINTSATVTAGRAAQQTPSRGSRKC